MNQEKIQQKMLEIKAHDWYEVYGEQYKAILDQNIMTIPFSFWYHESINDKEGIFPKSLDVYKMEDMIYLEPEDYPELYI